MPQADQQREKRTAAGRDKVPARVPGRGFGERSCDFMTVECCAARVRVQFVSHGNYRLSSDAGRLNVETKIAPPSIRKLRGYAIDPSLGTALSTVHVNELVYKLPWEELKRRGDGSLASYPVGEYLEIVDYDPATGRFYEPVDLDDPHLLSSGRTRTERQQSTVPSADGLRGHDDDYQALRTSAWPQAAVG